MRLLSRWDRWGWIFKLSLSVGLLWIVISNTGVSVSQLRILEPDKVLLASLVFVVQPAVDIPRWLIILKMLGYAIPLNRLLSYFYAGLLLNQVLPASIGGDAVRVFYLRTHAVPWLQNISSVVLDRLVALGGLAISYVALFGLGSKAITSHFDARAIDYAFIVGMFVAVVATGLILGLAASRQKWQKPGRIAERARDPVRDTAGTTRFPGKEILILGGLGISVHFIGAAGLALILQSLGHSIAFVDVFIISALLIIAQSLPISLGGWGAREFVAVALLQRVGIGANDAFFASIMLGLMSLLAALPGTVFWVAIPSRDRVERNDCFS